jgi:hypothetical protein
METVALNDSSLPFAWAGSLLTIVVDIKKRQKQAFKLQHLIYNSERATV